MGYIIIPTGPAVVEHSPSKKQVNVQLTEVGIPTSTSKPRFKEDSESFITTFEGSFQIEVEAGRAIAGQLTVNVPYSSSPGGQQTDGMEESSLNPPSCEVIELPKFVVQEVEDTQ